MQRPEVFYTYEWALAMEHAYSASITPLLFLAYEGESLVGLVALATDRARQTACFLANTTADYCDFVSEPEHRAKFVDAVFEELRALGLGTLTLANLPADSATVHALRTAARQSGYSLFARPAYVCARIVFRSAEHRESVKQSVTRKQMVRRYVKAMEKVAPVKLSHLTSAENVAEVLPAFARAHVARFLATGRVSNLARPERRIFLAQLAELLSQPGWIRLTSLMVGGRPVAWNYGFQFAGSWFWYQPTFDNSWERFAPGFCLLAKIVQEACDTPEINLVDLGLGAEDYKERLATDGRATLHITAATSAVDYARQAVRYHAAAVVKSSPRLESWVRASLRRVASLQRRLRTDGSLGLVAWMWQRCKTALSSQSEVVFFEWPGADGSGTPHLTSNSSKLQPIDWDLLAVAAMQYVDDEETLAYLKRAAGRLHSTASQGFALVTAESVPVHFCWIADFEGFRMSELDQRLKAPSPNAFVIFDCWTPRSVRGHGYYGATIFLVARQLRASGMLPWIFSAASNESSVHGVEKAGFVRRFSLVRRRFLLLSKEVRTEWFTPLRAGADPRAADDHKTTLSA